MKKTGMLLSLCCLALAAAAQQTEPKSAEQTTPEGTLITTRSFPVERVQNPTNADVYCGGFVSKDVVPNANFVSGGLESPNTTKYANNDLVFLAGHGYQTGQQYEIVRELRDPNGMNCLPGKIPC